jgi:hypothetical protein
MTHPFEPQHLEAPLSTEEAQAVCGRVASSDVWLGESAPEDFLREVVDTLTGFMRDEREAWALKTGEAPPER